MISAAWAIERRVLFSMPVSYHAANDIAREGILLCDIIAGKRGGKMLKR